MRCVAPGGLPAGVGDSEDLLGERDVLPPPRGAFSKRLCPSPRGPETVHLWGPDP